MSDNEYVKNVSVDENGIVSAELTDAGVKKYLPDYDPTEGLSISIQEVSAREDDCVVDPFFLPERLYVTEDMNKKKGTFDA